MVTEQAAEVAAAETTNANLGATIATTVGIGLAGYGIGKLIERGVKWVKSKIAARKAKTEVVEAQPEEVIEVEVVD
jgi:hypothetical protein